jgi:hypothetical protein
MHFAHGVLLVTATLAGTPIAIAVVASNVLKVEKQVVHPSSVVIYEVDGDPVVVQVVNWGPVAPTAGTSPRPYRVGMMSTLAKVKVARSSVKLRSAGCVLDAL